MELWFYKLSGLATDINAAIADTGLTADVKQTPNLTQLVSVTLPVGGAVVIGPLTRSPGAWQVTWPTPNGIDSTLWPLETETKDLVRLVELALIEGIEGSCLPSPYAWGRLQEDSITELASQLVDLGVDRVSLELEPLRSSDEDGRPKYRQASLNELRISDREDTNRTLVVSFDSHRGWFVDQVMPGVGESGRLDMAGALGLRPSLPRVEPAEVTVGQIARVLAEDTAWIGVQEGDHRHLWRYGPTPGREASIPKRARAAPPLLGFDGPVSAVRLVRRQGSRSWPRRLSSQSTSVRSRSALQLCSDTWGWPLRPVERHWSLLDQGSRRTLGSGQMPLACSSSELMRLAACGRRALKRAT